MENKTYLDNIPLRMCEFDRMYFYGEEFASFGMYILSGDDPDDIKHGIKEDPGTGVCLDSRDDYSKHLWMPGKILDGLEAIALYNEYMAQVPKDEDGKVAATMDNFDEFFRSKGFTEEW